MKLKTYYYTGKTTKEYEFETTEEQNKQLQEAEKEREKAVAWLEKYANLLQEGISLWPVSYKSKRQYEKDTSMEKVHERAYHSSNSVNRLTQIFCRNQQISLESSLKEKKEQEEKNKEKELTEYIAKAIVYLISEGKQYGVDFTAETAVDLANDVAYDKEVERIKKSLNGGYLSFSGDNYCENCSGWDGESKRCECGNRRVSFSEGYNHSFENPSVYPEAY